MFFLLLSAALAGELVVDGKVPFELRTRGMPMANLAYPALIRIPLPQSELDLAVYVDGNAHQVHVDIPSEGETWLVVGKTGITTGQGPSASSDASSPAEEALPPTVVELRATGIMMTVLLDGTRHHVQAGEPVKLELAAGSHEMMVRSADGTVVFARGRLLLSGGGTVVVQVAEGRMPDVAGEAGSWRPSLH